MRFVGAALGADPESTLSGVARGLRSAFAPVLSGS